MMKTSTLCFKMFMVMSIVAVAFGFQACDDDDTYYYYYPYGPTGLANALVTVKTDADDKLFFQLDDSTRLWPVNMETSPYGDKEVRALMNFDVVDKGLGTRDMDVHVNWMDSILTKQMAPDLGQELNEREYGSDPVEMVRDWVTIAEDGYLTLRFRTCWSYGAQPHFVNLLAAPEGDNAYVVEFRHNAYGDLNGVMADALVAFRLDQLPDTNGKTVKLKLKWNSFSGEKSAEFDYCSRRSTAASDPSGIVEQRSVVPMR